MLVGKWIVIGSDGIWFSPFENTYTFDTKKDALSSIRYAVLDTREKANTKRFSCGEYIYTPKCANGIEGRFYKIVRITKYNDEHYEKWIEEQESRKENLCLW